MNDFQSMESGKGELKDAYPSALDAALKKKRGKLYETSGLGENDSDQEKLEREAGKGLLGR